MCQVGDASADACRTSPTSTIAEPSRVTFCHFPHASADALRNQAEEITPDRSGGLRNLEAKVGAGQGGLGIFIRRVGRNSLSSLLFGSLRSYDVDLVR